jgi:very-short-patch-repair endonuclease
MKVAADLTLKLLDYIKQLESLRIKPAYAIPKEPFVLHEQDVLALPEVQLDLAEDGEEVWLRLPRIEPIPAPEPVEPLRPWVTLPRDPARLPELKGVAPPASGEGTKDALPRQLEDHPEIKALFGWYVEHQWTPWAATETARRQTIATYDRLFKLHHSVGGGADQPLELVWGIGYATWKRANPGQAVRHPLITQRCEVTLNAQTLDLEIRPRLAEPRLEADCYADMDVAGVAQLEAMWAQYKASPTIALNPFEPDSFSDILRTAVGLLDSTGVYLTGEAGRSCPSPAAHLQVTDGWVIFARERSSDLLIQDIERLKEKVKAAEALPPVIQSLVSLGSDEVPVQPEQPFRGLSTSQSAPQAFELYFPMPYNDEQVSIVGKLQHNEGVVVQGPPGTGKTHTIANVICHHLAQGKRVLVTAKSETALAVLREKLPEPVRPLSVALLADEREGMQQFEHAIQTIATQISGFSATRASDQIARAELTLDQLHAEILTVDRNIAEAAEHHLRRYVFQGAELTAAQLAERVVEGAEQYRWFDDAVPASLTNDVPISPPDIEQLRAARRDVGADLRYLQCTLPRAAELPEAAELVGWHRDLLKSRNIDEAVNGGEILPLVDATPETLQRVRDLQVFLSRREELQSAIVGSGFSWVVPVRERLRASKSDPMLTVLYALCADVMSLEAERLGLIADAVVVPTGAENNADYMQALERLLAGQRPFVMPFGKRDARELIEHTTIADAPPTGVEGWKQVDRAVRWRKASRALRAKWSGVAGELGIDAGAGALDADFKRLAAQADILGSLKTLAHEYDAPLHGKIAAVFGQRIADQVARDPSTLSQVSSSTTAHAERGHLAYVTTRLAALFHALSQHQGDVVDGLKAVLDDSLGAERTDERELLSRWSELRAELERLTDLSPQLDVIRRVANGLRDAGAPRWADRVSTVSASVEQDPVVPQSWLAAWNWRRAERFLDEIDAHHELRRLFTRRHSLTGSLERTYQELVALKAWLGVFNNSPPVVRQALQAYLTAIQAMGKGTGKRAARFRRNARDAMERAYRAVPCWVLPHWRVSEAIPAELGLFDLVIVDEASQSDITSLPALLRGKKLLVVGDEKQVSPSAVGTAEEVVNKLVQRFLSEQPHGAQMTPGKSIYDLARVVFAGNSVMLKEHFRCVPAIIEYSKREFYQHEIKPLRLPKANERLDPPLIDVFVHGGRREGYVNKAEGLAILAEIKNVIADPRCAGRTIGVVTLLGQHQARFIQELVTLHISPADIVAREIAVGDPSAFQGRERDIMMVSMVIGPDNRAVATRSDMQQRFNVALSRARDRMYLFRSVRPGEIREDSLNGRLMQHFRQPFSQDAEKVATLRDRCESGFEREMFDELVKRGYRVQPQVRCGAYRIDFVVEGADGRRLAIECDGDRFHGPGQWADDMARQRVLERAGWTFWRCFASSFTTSREAMVSDLLANLAAQGIEPLGSETVDTTRWVEHREADPFGVVLSDGPPEDVVDSLIDVDSAADESGEVPELEESR